ncbi:hypothetical protein FACS1894125_3130 [Actinomycetota bacterium]|nr:hypothetical protein FACS1894125_3130 [Actinomycetota bacterium]
MLDRRSYCVAQLRTKLIGYVKLRVSKGQDVPSEFCAGGVLGEVFLENLAQEVVVKLEELGILNDLEYAKSKLNAEIFFNNRSPAIAKQKLLSIGIDPPLVDELLENLDTQELKVSQLEYASKKWKSATKNIDLNDFKAVQKAKNRVIGQCARRGISFSVALEAING